MRDEADGYEGSGRQRVTLTLDQDTLEKLQQLGPDWQEHLNRILREALTENDD